VLIANPYGQMSQNFWFYNCPILSFTILMVSQKAVHPVNEYASRKSHGKPAVATSSLKINLEATLQDVYPSIINMRIRAVFNLGVNIAVPIHKWLFSAISASGSDFNPRNTSMYSCG